MLSDTFRYEQRRAIEEFSRAKHAEAAKADELDALLIEREREREARLIALEEGQRAATLTLMELLARTLEARIERVTRELAGLAAEAEARRIALVAATTKVKSVEKLEERRGAACAAASARTEQARLDDIRT